VENCCTLACISAYRGNKAHAPEKPQIGSWGEGQLTRELKLGGISNEKMSKNYVCAIKHTSEGRLPATKKQKKGEMVKASP
jgi:hypothetical protein